MVIVQHPGMIARVHIHRRMDPTNPGGEWTWEKWSMFLKYTLSTEKRLESGCLILRSELVGYHLLGPDYMSRAASMC